MTLEIMRVEYIGIHKDFFVFKQLTLEFIKMK